MGVTHRQWQLWLHLEERSPLSARWAFQQTRRSQPHDGSATRVRRRAFLVGGGWAGSGGIVALAGQEQTDGAVGCETENWQQDDPLLASFICPFLGRPVISGLWA